MPAITKKNAKPVPIEDQLLSAEPEAFFVPGDSDSPVVVDLQRKVDLFLRDDQRRRLNQWQRIIDAEESRLHTLNEKREKKRVEDADLSSDIGHLDKALRHGAANSPEVEAQRARWVAGRARIKEQIAEIEREKSRVVDTPLHLVLQAIRTAKGDLVAADPVALPEGLTPTEAFDEAMAKIAVLQDRKKAIDGTCPPLDDLKAIALAEVEKLAKDGEPKIGSLFNLRRRRTFSDELSFGKKVKWPHDYRHGPEINGLVVHYGKLLAHYLKPVILADLYARIEEQFARSTPMTDAERKSAHAVLDSQIEDLDYEAGAFAAMIEEAGGTVVYRPNMSALATIGLRVKRDDDDNEIPATM